MECNERRVGLELDSESISDVYVGSTGDKELQGFQMADMSVKDIKQSGNSPIIPTFIKRIDDNDRGKGELLAVAERVDDESLELVDGLKSFHWPLFRHRRSEGRSVRLV